MSTNHSERVSTFGLFFPSVALVTRRDGRFWPAGAEEAALRHVEYHCIIECILNIKQVALAPCLNSVSMAQARKVQSSGLLRFVSSPMDAPATLLESFLSRPNFALSYLLLL